MALGLALWRGGAAVDAVGRRIGCCVAAVLGGVAAHVAFKQLFALGSLAEVTRLALAERTLRSEEHKSELQSLMRISYAVFCLKKKRTRQTYKTRRCVTTRWAQPTVGGDE